MLLLVLAHSSSLLMLAHLPLEWLHNMRLIHAVRVHVCRQTEIHLRVLLMRRVVRRVPNVVLAGHHRASREWNCADEAVLDHPVRVRVVREMRARVSIVDESHYLIQLEYVCHVVLVCIDRESEIGQ